MSIVQFGSSQTGGGCYSRWIHQYESRWFRWEFAGLVPSAGRWPWDHPRSMAATRGEPLFDW